MKQKRYNAVFLFTAMNLLYTKRHQNLSINAQISGARLFALISTIQAIQLERLPHVFKLIVRNFKTVTELFTIQTVQPNGYHATGTTERQRWPRRDSTHVTTIGGVSIVRQPLSRHTKFSISNKHRCKPTCFYITVRSASELAMSSIDSFDRTVPTSISFPVYNWV